VTTQPLGDARATTAEIDAGAERAIRDSEERYRAFVANSTEGIWRLEFDPPIPIDLPIDEQVERAYRDGRLAECNDVLARRYGLEHADSLIGRTLDVLLPSSDPKARACVASMIGAGYKVSEAESTARDAQGRTRQFAHSMIGAIEDGALRRIWGTQRDIGAQKLVEARLGEGEARFRVMADAAPLMMWMAGPDGQRTWCNQPWLRFVGRSLADETCDGWVSSVHPHDLPRFLDAFARARAARAPFSSEYRLRRFDGEYRWVLDNATPVDGEEPGHYIGSCIDITVQKHASSAAAYLAAIVDSADDAIISKDLDGIIQWCNATAEHLFGYSAAELIGRPVRMLIPPERQSEEDEILRRIRAGERVEHFETIRMTKDGQRRHISLTISPVRDAAGTIIGVSKIARDITEQKQAAAERTSQQEWFRVTLASIADAVIATDVAGRIAFMNPVAERLTGCRADDARGRPCGEVFQLVEARSRDSVRDPMSRVLKGSVSDGPPSDVILVSADGTERPIEDSGAPIRDHDGQIVGVVLVFRDVSERRRIDSERQAATLERERLLEAERVARAEAERASRVKDDFVAMVSHELRTPLNAILGWTQLMMQARGDAALMERGLDLVTRNTRLQAQLITDLLDISRIVAGKLRLEIQSVDLQVVIIDAIETVQHEAAAKGVEIRPALDPAAGVIAGDPARLQQVVWNLLSNSIKFTTRGGHVTITLRRAGTGAEITVSDDGAGIKPEFLPHVFDRFHQADRSITRRFGGLGLGLAIVKHLVDLHGGSVRAESAGENHGATFTVLLPAGAALSLLDGGAGGGDQILERSDAPALDGIRVLVVEDEPDTREFLERLLESHGATVMSAGSAVEALSLLGSSGADVMISDIGLPDVDGYDLMQRIRRSGSDDGAGIPAIALTAYARWEDRTRALRAGYQAHIAKPVEPGELVATIASLAGFIERRRQPR
jgi:PAS domain S-box-containing protein